MSELDKNNKDEEEKLKNESIINELKSKLDEQIKKTNKLEKEMEELKKIVEEERKKREEEEKKKALYFPRPNYDGISIVDALKSIGVDSNYNYRCTIAAKNRIDGYVGSAEQNIQMLNLLKNGNLIRP